MMNFKVYSTGIIGAMPSELADIRATLGEGEVRTINGFEFHMNEYKGKTIVSVCCGIGKVNAAQCVQTMISHYMINRIINTGIAGGMNPDVKVGDIVISTETVPHDIDPHFLNDYAPFCSVFKADNKLINRAESVCRDKGISCFKGKIISGDVFLTDTAAKAKLVEVHSPYAVDMESAAIGQVCFRAGVPYVSVRCISDNADDEGAMSFEEFEKKAAKRVADVVLAMTEK